MVNRERASKRVVHELYELSENYWWNAGVSQVEQLAEQNLHFLVCLY